MDFTFRENKLNLQEVVSPPISSKSTVPDWYKKIRPNKELPNLKSCIPFLDSLIGGYTQVTWADIEIVAGPDAPTTSVTSSVSILSRRKTPSVPTTDDYYKIEFTWVRHWIPLLPEGYSVLLTHPLNRLDLPFTTLSAIIDLDTSFPHTIGKIPFYLKKNFTGTIPAGTPMFQMFPMRREPWESVIKDFDPELAEKDTARVNSFTERKLYKHHKKEYN